MGFLGHVFALGNAYNQVLSCCHCLTSARPLFFVVHKNVKIYLAMSFSQHRQVFFQNFILPSWFLLIFLDFYPLQIQPLPADEESRGPAPPARPLGGQGGVHRDGRHIHGPAGRVQGLLYQEPSRRPLWPLFQQRRRGSQVFRMFPVAGRAYIRKCY